MSEKFFGILKTNVFTEASQRYLMRHGRLLMTLSIYIISEFN
jgi:hypothetical protein